MLTWIPLRDGSEDERAMTLCKSDCMRAVAACIAWVCAGRGKSSEAVYVEERRVPMVEKPVTCP